MCAFNFQIYHILEIANCVYYTLLAACGAMREQTNAERPFKHDQGASFNQSAFIAFTSLFWQGQPLLPPPPPRLSAVRRVTRSVHEHTYHTPEKQRGIEIPWFSVVACYKTFARSVSPRNFCATGLALLCARILEAYIYIIRDLFFGNSQRSVGMCVLHNPLGTASECWVQK